ncbi:MAG TPA: hypothetical protein VH206_23270 [Xanthobacteraceae bacterium]|jgi:hypothetical protein|nr:hypothetical protein [Xanthobacteraceae bacterium]
MAQSADQSPNQPSGDGEKIDATQGNGASEKASADYLKNLPIVVSPRLDAGEDDDIFDEEPVEHVEAAAPKVEAPPSTRFLMLAATVAFAAAFGSFVGSVSGTGLAHFVYAPQPSAAVPTAAAENTSDALRSVKQQLAELSTIKASLDNAARNSTSQFAKIADRLDRIDQHAAVAPETTGSISAARADASSAQPSAAALAKSSDRVLPNWIVQDVRSGRALVESSGGGMFDVAAGSVLPGLGRVGGIKRQDGQWLVLTEGGTITSTGH